MKLQHKNLNNMKRKFLLSLAIAFGLAGSVWAQPSGTRTIGGKTYYEITNAADLVSFASYVNAGNVSANAILTADITLSSSQTSSWKPIGCWTPKVNGANVMYTGHFDGDNHEITGFDVTVNQDYYGLFGVVSAGAVIENFKINGEITNSDKTNIGVIAYARDTEVNIRNIQSYLIINNNGNDKNVGGILGSGNGGTTNIDRCAFFGTINANDKTNVGGIVGYFKNGNSTKVNINNCLFNGKITSNNNTSNCGGIAGYGGANVNSVKIKNSLSIGSITGTTTKKGQFFGNILNTGSSITNSFCQGDNINGKGSSALTTLDAAVVTDEQLASGEFCYLLNGSTSGGTKWYQTIGTDDYPYPYSSGHGTVYRNGTFCPDTDAPQGVYTYGNTDDAVTGEHDYNESNGLCSYCGYPKSDYMTPESSYYVIDDATKLKWFAAYVNYINPAVNAKLTANIDLEGIAWTPIGNSTNKYTGIFDGLGHAITNFSYTATSDNNGLFGYIDGATVMNFSISGTLTSTFTKNGVVGRADGAAVVSGIHSSLNLNVSNCKAHTGGIVGGDGGNTQHTLLVENCIYDGTLTHSGTGDCQGGILGYAYMGGIKNCIFSGTIIGENSKYGGMLGYCKIATFGGVQNCLSIGNIVCDGGCTTAAAIIGVWNGPVSSNIKNNFYCLEEGSTPTAGVTYGKDGKTLTGIDAVDADQLSSGEVAYKLGTAFYQTIGSDNYPVLNSTHGVVGKIADCGYGTLYAADTDVTIPSGITAFAGKNNGTSIKLTAIADKIKAGEAVVLVGDEGFYSFMPTTGASDVEENDLEGSDGTVTTDDSYIVYALANKTNGVGFYKVNAGVKVPAGRAYFKVSTGASAKAFYLFGEDDATSLSEELRIKSEESDAAIYNLSGQRISKLQKGFNIVNGKKVLF